MLTEAERDRLREKLRWGKPRETPQWDALNSSDYHSKTDRGCNTDQYRGMLRVHGVPDRPTNEEFQTAVTARLQSQ